MTALKNHGRAVLFHGHSHMMFEAQELDEKANYTKINGYHSVHVPSVGNPRWVLSADGSWSDNPAKAPVSPQAYLVDVYEDCIVLNGLSFSGTNATPVPLGTYKINT
jgi:hypothetical protein